MNHSTPDILYEAASVWNALTEYNYIFTYGYKNKLHTITLTFSPEDFPHLAGFQYLKDIKFPRYNPEKIVFQILNGIITSTHISCATQYEEMVLPRLEAMVRMKETLDSDFKLFSYMPRMYPFYTKIKADYLISHHSEITSFIFILQATSNGSAKCDYLCCSAFKQGDRNFEQNQRLYSLLKKERIHLPSNAYTLLFDKITPSPPKSTPHTAS